MKKTRSATRTGRRSADVLHSLEDHRFPSPAFQFFAYSCVCGRDVAGHALATCRPARSSPVPSFCSQSSRFCPSERSLSTRSKAAFRRGTLRAVRPTASSCSEAGSRRSSRSAFGEPVFNGSASRMLAMAKLARDYPNARIVYSGGDASLFGNGVRETDFVYPALESLGVARERVQLETQSRNTAENAAFTKAAGESKTRRALAACDVRTSHAACDRLLPEGRLSCRSLSGWLVGCGRSRRAMGARTGERPGASRRGRV